MASRTVSPWLWAEGVGADQAPSGEGLVGLLGLPVARDGLVPLGGFDAALGGVGGPVDGEVGGEQPDLVGVLVRPGRQGERGVVAAAVPVAAVPVVDDPGGHGGVVRSRSPARFLGSRAVSLRARAVWTRSWASPSTFRTLGAQDCRVVGAEHYVRAAQRVPGRWAG